jgi:RNA polymerase sigma-70 factor (ECF subfamily)
VAPARLPSGLVALTDRELMAEATAGHVDAFDELYERYRDRAFRVARSVCHDNGQAEDAVQEAFLTIWRSCANYRSERGTVAAWLLTVVRYRAIDLMRRSRGSAAQPSDAADRVRDPGADDVGQRILEGEQHDDFQALLSLLPDVQHEVITLAFYGELSHAEIADRLKLPPGTVKGRMRLGMDKLRVSLTTVDPKPNTVPR